MPKFVTNTNDHSVELQSHDGDSVMVGPKARRARVANKFDWQVPGGVVVEDGGEDVVDPTRHVRGRPLRPLMRPPRSVAEALDLQAKGMLPHQTPAERAAARAAAREAVNKLPAPKTEGSTALLSPQPQASERVSIRRPEPRGDADEGPRSDA